MNELRAPDPTLDAMDPSDLVYHGIADRAHLSRDCRGADGMGVAMSPYYARWFAVPCRECFPDAPEPGYALRCITPQSDERTPVAERGLAWQVQP